MGASEFASVHPRLMQVIQRHLDSLRRSMDGDELHGLIARILRRHSRQGPLDAACFAELYHHLDAYARDPVSLPSARIKARLLQQHIAPYLPDDGETSVVPTEVPAATSPESTSVDVPYQQHANEPALRGTLHARLDAAQDRRQQYEALRRSEQDAWQAIYGVARDFELLKKVWSRHHEEIADDRDRLEQKLADTEQTLASVEETARQLRSDVDSARQSAARKVVRRTPRLLRGGNARLVSRESFLQQLQAEVSRVKRSGGTAVLAMLGVEELRALAEQYGDGADAAALKCYAREILTGFRAYDIIAQYNDNVFAVLLPDTGADGAVRALEKAQKRAAGTHVGHDGRRFPLPGFHGALTPHHAGEEPLAWLQRAESAIDTARQQDSEHLVVA